MALRFHQPHMQDTDEDEKTAVEALAQDPQAVQAIAIAGGLDEATFRAEIGVFREEMGDRFDGVEALLAGYNDALLEGQNVLLEGQDEVKALLKEQVAAKKGRALAHQDKVRPQFCATAVVNCGCELL